MLINLINLVKTRLFFETKHRYMICVAPPDCFQFRIRWLFRALRSKICRYSKHNLFPLQLTKHKGFESVRWLLCWIINLIDLLVDVYVGTKWSRQVVSLETGMANGLSSVLQNWASQENRKSQVKHKWLNYTSAWPTVFTCQPLILPLWNVQHHLHVHSMFDVYT